MGRIKSAWEIALERTEDIEIDIDTIRKNETLDKIRRLAGAYLIAEKREDGDLEEKLSSFELKDIREALSQTIINKLSLPADEVVDDRYTRISFLVSMIANRPDTLELFNQIANFLMQYPMHKKQLIEQLKAQFEPALREKEAKMKEQYGESIHLSLEQDKEFLEILKKNLERLDEQYNATLIDAKEQLKSCLV
jgi:hypothetical protein